MKQRTTRLYKKSFAIYHSDTFFRYNVDQQTLQRQTGAFCSDRHLCADISVIAVVCMRQETQLSPTNRPTRLHADVPWLRFIGRILRVLPTLLPFDGLVHTDCLVWGKLEWLGYNLVKVAWWSTQSFGHNTSTWQTDSHVATANAVLTHCVVRQK